MQRSFRQLGQKTSSQVEQTFSGMNASAVSNFFLKFDQNQFVPEVPQSGFLHSDDFTQNCHDDVIL